MKRKEIDRGEFQLTTTEDEGLLVLFRGWWYSLADGFIGGGIVKSRYDEGKETYLEANRKDLENYTQDE